MFNANLINSFVKIMCLSHIKRQPSKEYGNGLRDNVLSAVKILTETFSDISLKLTLF